MWECVRIFWKSTGDQQMMVFFMSIYNMSIEYHSKSFKGNKDVLFWYIISKKKTIITFLKLITIIFFNLINIYNLSYYPISVSNNTLSSTITLTAKTHSFKKISTINLW